MDQYGNLIDRHNLWEMVGVRFRRALFPGYSDTVEYSLGCPADLQPGADGDRSTDDGERSERVVELPRLASPGVYHIEARLNYRKVDQYLLNFLFGEDSGLTAPIVQVAESTATVRVAPGGRKATEPAPVDPAVGG